MSKQYHKIEKLQRLKTKNHTDKESALDQKTCGISFVEKISLNRKYIFEILLIGSIIVLLYLEFRRPEIIIDTIDVPEDIEKLGYTGNVVAERLADEAHKIVLEIRKPPPQKLWSEEVLSMSEVKTYTQVPDILVPTTQFSLRSITRFIRQEFSDFFDTNSVYVHGEIVHDNDKIVLTLRNLSGENSPIAERIVKKSVEQLFNEGGVALLKLTNPSVMVIYAYKNFVIQLSKLSNVKKNFNDVIQAAEYCLRYSPANDDSLVHTIWGNALLDLRRPTEAIEQYKKAIAINHQFANAYNNWGNALLDLKKPKEAIEQFKNAVDIDPNFEAAYNNWGNAQQTLGLSFENQYQNKEASFHFNIAICLYKKAIKIDPQFAYAHNNLGAAFYNNKQFENAIMQYKKAIEIDPKYVVPYINLAATYIRTAQPDKANEQYEILVTKVDPHNAQAYKDWGSNLLNTGIRINDRDRIKEAKKKFEKSIGFNSKDVDTYFRLANTFLQLHQPYEAIKQCEIALKIDRYSASIYEIWGSALFELKRHKEGKVKFQKAKDLREKH
jgi:tetratricopeptide (TPR) repeat protein